MERYNGKRRAKIIQLAREFKAANVDVYDKNSNLSEGQIINRISMFHMKNETLKRLFLQKVDELYQ
jgi:hypothetical protein